MAAGRLRAVGGGGGRDLELRKLLRRFLDVCNAIDYAHSRGVIHRDLKPANIILGKHGETLVVDWGLAKAVSRADPFAGEQTIAPSSSGSSETLPGSALGTPAYMSPEQAGGDLDRLGPRSDVYSLGATLYCLLTGKPPFEGEDVGEILRRVQAGDVRAPREVDPLLDKALEAVCLKAMATKPAERYASCRALAEEIERWAADEPVVAWREPLSRRVRRWATRNRTAVASVAVALIAGVVGLSAVLAVQTQAKADVTRALAGERDANRALAASNVALERSKAAVQARYDLAVEAIQAFHTGVSEDFLLKQDQFKELRDGLLRSAQDFYGKLSALLGRETDPAAAAGRFWRRTARLADLTGKVGSKEDALKAHRAVLAAREALAAEPAAGAAATVDLGRSLNEVAGLLGETGRTGEALAACRGSESLLSGPAGTGTRRARAAAGGLPVAAGHVPDQYGPVRRRPGRLPAGAGRPGVAGRRPRSPGRGRSRPGGHGQPDRHPAGADGQAVGGGGRVPPGAGALREAGRRPPCPHRPPLTRGGQPPQPWPPDDGNGQADGGRGRVPPGAGDLPEAGRRHARRLRGPPPTGAFAPPLRRLAGADGQADGGRGRVPRGAGDPPEAGRR